MKDLFYTIASTITEWITGCDGTGTGLEGIVKVVRYIHVLEDVKFFINIAVAAIVVGLIICVASKVWNFSDEKTQNEFVSTETESEN